MTVANLAAHAQAGLVAMALGFLFFTFVIQSVGLAKSAMVIALWLPTNYIFTKAYMLVLIGTGMFTIAVFIAKINPNLPNPLSKHFTAILFICAGLLVSPHLTLNVGY
ncbi:hypothetical protein [Roseibium sp. TrichSKD4]|uniref:hypothetical protein n=1 Tax=Roseibium sp. TrichSKD4 TaxID=744980 RepID=UPI00058D2F10|nr:hypothetical protein [Roseibium sp. TrichSKD4]